MKWISSIPCLRVVRQTRSSSSSPPRHIGLLPFAGGSHNPCCGGAGALRVPPALSREGGRAASPCLRLAPAAEDETAEGDAEAERTEREAADRDHFAPPRETLPASDRLLLFPRQLLAAASFA